MKYVLVFGLVLLATLVYAVATAEANDSVNPYDWDGDNVPNNFDACPGDPGVELFSGCPVPDEYKDLFTDNSGQGGANPSNHDNIVNPDDPDGDGVPGHYDACPFEFGPMWTDGCPVEYVY